MKRGVLVVLAGLVVSLLLIACDKDLPDNKLSGKEVLVRVRLVGIAEGKETDATRSASMPTQERVATPVGDGVVMEMRMERDTSALRAATSQLDEYARFRVVAVIHGTSTFISYGDFTIHDGTVAGGLHVPDNDSYDFICYSYNSSNPIEALDYKQDDAIPDSKMIPALDGAKGLLWKKIEDIPVSGSAELEILLSQVLARVQVVIDCSYNNWTITGVTKAISLGSAYSGGTVRLTDKTVTSPSVTPTLSTISWSGSGSQRKSEILLMPKGNGTLTVGVPAGAISIQGGSAIPKSVVTATYSSDLVGGLSYTLRIKFRAPKFAGSNIYWEGNATSGKMTFDT
jgi:hypothetical protein